MAGPKWSAVRSTMTHGHELEKQLTMIDAFLVRMTLIPAAFSILGRATWWAPRWLLRILPDLDIEGHELEKELTTQSRPG